MRALKLEWEEVACPSALLAVSLEWWKDPPFLCRLIVGAGIGNFLPLLLLLLLLLLPPVFPSAAVLLATKGHAELSGSMKATAAISAFLERRDLMTFLKTDFPFLPEEVGSLALPLALLALALVWVLEAEEFPEEGGAGGGTT